MEQFREAIIRNSYILGEGAEGIYSDITIAIKNSNKSNLTFGENIELKNSEVLKKIEMQFQNKWIDEYHNKGIFFEIKILNIGIDKSGRKYAIENSVNGVMHEALTKIGILTPQIFGL
ncbi:hypothetical protein FEDK69T_30830 [Flavobacterium enshiense DK69]|uniref:Uncharacterized protein n=1 Tax=Flavobacterium enshiense DK69 TaxID=1107311 RepID=V6S0N3_9FLAO|nr:hypothetical protein [Flavobacterium enshiense]ESU19827.1 hypothetical protein FEDK69T_30830 [Flavobacterium enshiense DK69]KGO93124.1 hypothetical protein Q767_15215 [Flavobacterium enshiense DK69]